MTRVVLLCAALLALVCSASAMQGRSHLLRMVKRADSLIEQVSESSESGASLQENSESGAAVGSLSENSLSSGAGSLSEGSLSQQLSSQAGSGSLGSNSGSRSEESSRSLESSSGSGYSGSGSSTHDIYSSSSSSTSSSGSLSSSSMPSSSLPPQTSSTGEDPKAVEERLRREIEEKVIREREADWARQRKDLEEQGSKKERLLQLQMVDQLKKARTEAEQSARRILSDAQAKAKEMMQSAKPPVNPDEERKRQENAAKNAILLKPVSTGGDTDIDPEALGLAPPMSVDTNLIKHASDLTKKADIRHEKFEDQHEIDCSGPICPFAKNKKVDAQA